ncbi:microtubule-associated protein futsch-like [Homarus americanus]|nr:microtubule-associated protein futsch-like [Homarus americanus]
MSPVLHQSDITTDVDEVDTKQFEGEEQEYSFVSPSKDTTNNDEFYSFTEEESVDKFTEDEEELEGAETSKEAGKSEDEEKEMLEGTEESDIEGVERSRELGESEDDRVLKVKCTEEADDDTTRPLEGDEEMHDEGLYDNMDPEETEKAEEEALSFTFDERSESTHSSIVDNDEFCIGLPSENEDMHGIEERAHDTLNSAVKEGEEVPEMCLNESEIINPLEFSDSEESDTANDKSSNREQEELFINENLAAKEKILSVNEDIPTDVTESDMKEVCAMEKSYITGDKCENQSTNNELKEEGLVVEETVVDNGMHIMDTDHEITEEEEEMIADAISDEEDDICLSLNASERFSPLRFSDSEEEKKETESCINQVEDICSNEANSAVEEKLSEVSEDQGAKILEGNNAEEKSMEADIPEEQKIEASTPAESSNEPDVMEREDEATVVLGETVEAVVPKQEEGSGVTNIDQLCSNDVQGNEGEISATTSVLKEIAGVLNEQGNEGEISATTSVLKEIGDVLNEQGNEGEISATTSVLKEIGDVLNEQGNEGEISATTSVLKEIGDVLNEQRTETVTENSKYVKVDEKGYSEQDSQVLKSEEEAYQPVEISSEEVVQKTEVLDSEEVTEEKHEEMEVTKAIKNEEMDVMENEMQVSKMTTQNGKGGEKICQDSVLGSNLQAVNQEVSVKDDKIIPDNETSMEVTEETKLSLSPKRGSSPIEAANIPPEATEDATSSSPRSSRLSSVVDTDTTIDEAMVQNASPTGSFRHGEKISQPISPSSSPRLSSSVDASTVHEEITQSYSTGRSSRHSEAAGPLTSDIEKDGVAVSLKGSLKHGDDTNAFTKVTEACKIVSAKLNLSDAEMSPIDTEERTLTLLPSSTQDDTVDITVKVDKETLSPDKFSTQDSETTLKPGEKLAIKTPPQQSLESFCADTSLVTTPKRSVRHTHGSDSQVVVAKEDTPSKVATPLRRSRRLSSASPATPSTPNRTSKTITNAEVITPTRELFKAADVVERITRSGRKILQVPTPLTKSRSAQGPTHDTLDKRSTRGTVVPEEVEKVSQKLELSPGVATLGATASVLNHKRSVSPSTQDVLPTPPVSPTAPSARQQKTQNTEEDSGRVILTRSRRRSARLSVSEETLETIVEGQKLERGSGGSEIEEKDTVSHSTKTPIKGTPTRTRRSRRLSTTSETLETIAEDAELSSRVTGDLRTVTSTHVKSHLGVEEWSSDVPEKKTPLRTRRKSITSDTADDTPEKKTPSRRRRKSVASDSVEVTPEKKISSRRRRKSVSSDTADDTPEKKTPSQKRRKSITSDTADDTPEKKTPSRRRSVASDTVEVTPEKTASSRRGRKSVTSDTADDTPEKKTPSRRRRSVASDIVEVTPEKKTPLRRRRSVASDTAEVTPERKNPRRKLKESLGGSDTEDISQRNTLDVTASTIRQTRRRSMSEKGISRREETNALEITQISPDRMSTRSSGTSSVTSIKDSESSEEDNIIKRRFSKRQSERGGKIIKPIHPVVEELSTGRRKSRRLTLSSTLSTTAMLQLPNQPHKPSRKSVTSLKVYTESDEGEPLLTPEPDHRIGKSKKSLPSSTSILLIQGSDEDEEMVLEGGMDTADEADDEVLISASVSMAQDSPDLPLNLIEVVGKGKNKRKGSLSLGQKGRRTTKIPRRSLHSLKIHAETSKNKAEDVTGVAVTTTKLSQRSSRGSKDTSVLGMAPEDTSVLKEADSDNDDVFMENKGEIKKTVLEEEEIEKGQEGKVTMTEMEKEKRETDEDNEEHSTAPQFQFAKPKSVTSTRKVRALEYLTSEAVEFLFSPPQVAGRIVRHHAKLEEGVKTSSSESETESETGKRTSRRKQ